MEQDERTAGIHRLPVTELVNRFYGEVQQAGGSRRDASSLTPRL